MGQRVLVLIGGTAGGQLILLIASPVLTRLYSPADFGTYGAFAAIVTVVALVSGFRYEMAIPLARSEQRAAELLSAALVGVVFTSMVAGTVFIFARARVLPGSTPLVAALFPVAVIAAGVYQVFSHWAIRTSEYRSLAVTRITQSLGSAAVQVAGGFAVAGPLGLLIGDVVGRGAGSLRLGSSAWSRLRKSPTTVAGVIQAAKDERRFPLITMWSTLLNALGLQLPTILFSALYGSQQAGWYSLAARAVGLPTFVLAGATAQVYLGEAAERYNRAQPLAPLFLKLTAGLAAVAVGPTLLALFFGQRLFQLVFGASWATSGRYIQYLAIAFMLQLIVSPVSQTLTITGRQGLQAVWDVTRLTAVLMVIVGAHRLGASAGTTVLLYGVTTAACYIILYAMSAMAARGPRSRLPADRPIMPVDETLDGPGLDAQT